jgi:uncharacterized membrane protein YfcA
MPDFIWTYAALCAFAFLAGAMNSIAGGGTLLTFPALMTAFAVLGQDAAAMANGTSTVALLPGSFAGAFGYRNELRECRRFAVRMFLPSLAGGFLGAWLVSQAPEAFAKLVPWLILTAAVLFLVQAPLSKWLKRRSAAEGKHPDHHEPSWLTQAMVIGFQFLIAVYGGYFGAGIGILMLSALGFMGIGNIHRMNAVKTFLAATINGASVVVFIENGLVDWGYAVPMAVSAIIGGYVGARVARRLPASAVRFAVIVIAFGLATYYFIQQYL